MSAGMGGEPEIGVCIPIPVHLLEDGPWIPGVDGNSLPQGPGDIEDPGSP